jgi:hypothetical protein
MTDHKWPRAIQKLRKGLEDPAGAGDLVGRAYDFVLQQPVNRFVEGDRLLASLERVLDERLVEPYVQTHVRAFLQREWERSKERADVVGDWLTAEAKAELRSLAARPVDFDKRFLDRLVQDDSTRHMLRSIVQETLDRFVSGFKSTLSSVGELGGGRLGGFAGRASKGLLGTVLGQVEANLQRAVTAFVNGSMNVMLERLVAILSSPDTGRQLARTKLAVFDQLMKLPTAKVNAGLHKGSTLDDVLEAVPGVISHNLERETVRAGVLEELEAWLSTEGEKTVGELLDGDEHAAAVRQDVVELGGPLLADFAKSDLYLEWLKAHC